MEGEDGRRRRSLLLFPSPFQGHLTPMLNLASLLHSRNFSITIIQTNFNSLNPNRFPHFTFHFIDDGLSSMESSLSDTTDVLNFLNSSCLQPFKHCLARILTQPDPISCLIVDPMWKFTSDVAHKFNLPRIALRSGSLSAFLVYHSLPLFRLKGYFPLQECKLDEAVLEFPPLKMKDLPSERVHELLSTLVEETNNSKAIICNTFEELESSAIQKLQQSVPNISVFTIGPLHKLSASSPSTSLLTHDQTSITWLNSQPPNSVLYVCFGSAVMMTEPEFLEIAWGLANSNQPFLWVVRPGLINGSDSNDPGSIDGYLENVGDRGHIVEWAPQVEVLAHKSVGGFWTHCGWNSTIESVSEGVPMICMPFFADQGVTARYVSDGWGVGLRLERGVQRDEIESTIRRLMVEEGGKEMKNRVMDLKEKAELALMESGSSNRSLERLISFLCSL